MVVNHGLLRHTPLLLKLSRRTCLISNPVVLRRLVSKDHQTPWRDSSDEQSVFIEDGFVRHTIFTVNFFRRFIKMSLVGALASAVTGVALYEGAHIWVENVSLAPENDAEVREWEWNLEAEKWSGGDKGGTDPSLGLRARHAVRGAWMAQHWGIGSGASVIGSNAFSGRGPSSGAGGLNVVEARLGFAQDFLNIAISVAQEKLSTGKLRWQTLSELLSRYAGVLERIGSKDALIEARSNLERVCGKGVDSAQTALKLGDLSHRVGDSQVALVWWTRAIQLSWPEGELFLTNILPTLPASTPSSPLAQRVLASTLVSLSAFHATSGQLLQARAVDEASLDLLRSIHPPESVASTSPPQILHGLYLLHRSSLISIHLAEVLFALRSPLKSSMELLTAAAASSERVALALTGLPHTHPDVLNSKIPHPPATEAPLLQVYSKSQSMARPALCLLRDARRTAAEVWNLIGILIEDTEKSEPEKALKCYERALGWACVASDGPGGIGQPGEGILETEWKVLWRNYTRLRNTVYK